MTMYLFGELHFTTGALIVDKWMKRAKQLDSKGYHDLATDLRTSARYVADSAHECMEKELKMLVDIKPKVSFFEGVDPFPHRKNDPRMVIASTVGAKLRYLDEKNIDNYDAIGKLLRKGYSVDHPLIQKKEKKREKDWFNQIRKVDSDSTVIVGTGHIGGLSELLKKAKKDFKIYHKYDIPKDYGCESINFQTGVV